MPPFLDADLNASVCSAVSNLPLEFMLTSYAPTPGTSFSTFLLQGRAPFILPNDIAQRSRKEMGRAA